MQMFLQIHLRSCWQFWSAALLGKWWYWHLISVHCPAPNGAHCFLQEWVGATLFPPNTASRSQVVSIPCRKWFRLLLRWDHLCCQFQPPWLSFLSLLQGRPEFTTCSWLCRAESTLWFDFGSCVTGFYSGSLPGIVLASDVYLANFVQVRMSGRLFLKHFNGFIVLRGTFATKGNHHLFPKTFWRRSLQLLRCGCGALSLERAVRSTLKETMWMCLKCPSVYKRNLFRSHGDPSNLPHGT